jgi:hypothetical protein
VQLRKEACARSREGIERQVPQGNLPSLDVDLNGTADALTDGLLIVRYLFGLPARH